MTYWVTIFLLAYISVSTCFFLITRLINRSGRLYGFRERLFVWKVAAIGPILIVSMALVLGLTMPNSFKALPDFLSISTHSEGLSESGDHRTVEFASEANEQPELPDRLTFSKILWSTSDYVVAVWLLMMLVQLFKYLRDYRFLKRKLYTALPVEDPEILALCRSLLPGEWDRKKIKVLSLAENISPFLFGSCCLVLPARMQTDMTREEKKSVLAHEIAHLQRKDFITLRLLNLLNAIFFFQPLNRLISVEINELLEEASDHEAIQQSSEHDLVQSMLKIAGWIGNNSGVNSLVQGFALESQSRLFERINKIVMDKPKKYMRLRTHILLPVALLVSALFLSASSMVIDEVFPDPKSFKMEVNAGELELVSIDAFGVALKRQLLQDDLIDNGETALFTLYSDALIINAREFRGAVLVQKYWKLFDSILKRENKEFFWPSYESLIVRISQSSRNSGTDVSKESFLHSLMEALEKDRFDKPEPGQPVVLSLSDQGLSSNLESNLSTEATKKFLQSQLEYHFMMVNSPELEAAVFISVQ